MRIASDPFARQEAVADAGEAAVRGEKKAAPKRKMRRAGRPSVPKTFGSRSK